MFLELPELTTNPFPKLKFLIYEGSIKQQILNFLLEYSPNLQTVDLICSKSVLNPRCLQKLKIFPKQFLTSLKIELVVETSGTKFLNEMKKIIAESPLLSILGK